LNCCCADCAVIHVVSFGPAVVLAANPSLATIFMLYLMELLLCLACSKTVNPGHSFHVVPFGTAVVLAAKPSLATFFMLYLLELLSCLQQNLPWPPHASLTSSSA